MLNSFGHFAFIICHILTPAYYQNNAGAKITASMTIVLIGVTIVIGICDQVSTNLLRSGLP